MMDLRPHRQYTEGLTQKCPRAVGAAGGVATKEKSSMHPETTAGRCLMPARHMAPSTCYLGVEEPRCR
jgi:hypothetical protein